MHQNVLNFLAPYNPQDPSELLFKQCADCQEIAIMVKEPYTNKQILNVINLLMCCGMYVHDMEDYDRWADTNKTWLHLSPFIQMAYQRPLQMGASTTMQGGYSSTNRFASLPTAADVSNDNITKTVAGTINVHMANLSTKTTSLLEADASQINTLLEQLVVYSQQLSLQQLAIMQ
jgi:hypothetical protein